MNYFTSEKRYSTVNEFYRQTFGSKVYKITLNGDFTCPNRDGKISYSGCIYCSESGSGDFAGKKEDTLENQFQAIKSMMENKWQEGKFIVYFQANTNTYAPVVKLRSLFDKAITLHPDIIGLSIATRPDCLEEDVLDYLEELNSKTYLTIELGLQSIHEETMDFINRGHDLKTFEMAVKELRNRNINVVVHIINGLPGETKEMMLQTTRYLNTLPIQGVKIHMLFIQRNTQLAYLYQKNPFPLLSREAYVDIVVSQLELLNDSIIIHRLTGDAPREELIEPKWSLKKLVVANEIDKLMRQKNSFQGILT